MLDDCLYNLELSVVCGSWFRYITILEEKVLVLLTFMGEKIHVSPIISNQVRSVTLTIILRLYQGIQDAVPVLLNFPTLPEKDISIFIMRNDSHSVVLGRENVARASMEVTAEVLESLNQHCRLDGQVERSRNTGTTRHLKYL